MRVLPILFLALILASCQEKPLENKDFESKSYKLFFMGIQPESEKFKNEYFLNSHPDFYIDNKEILENIKDNLTENKKANIRLFQADYSLAIVEEGFGSETIGTVDVSRKLINISGKLYTLSQELSLTPEIHLKPLEKSSINLSSLKKSRKLLHLIAANNGAISARPGSLYNITNYNGMAIIKARKDYLGNSEINQKTIEKVKNDLKDLGQIFISASFCNDETYCTFYIYSKKINQDAIPNEYEILKPLSDSFEDKILVHTVSLDNLKNDMIRNKLHIDLN